MIYFTGDRLIDLLRLLNISSEWGKLYNETLDIADYYGNKLTGGVPDAEGWITWAGGECPIPEAKGGEYEIKFRNGKLDGDLFARHWNWDHNGKDQDYHIVAYRLIKPDHSQFANSEQDNKPKPDWSTAPKWVWTWLPAAIPTGFERNIRNTDNDNYSIDNWKDSLQPRPTVVEKDYPVIDGFRKHNCRDYEIPFCRKVRVQRRDKSFSEGHSYDFNWDENGMDTIIGWKIV